MTKRKPQIHRATSSASNEHGLPFVIADAFYAVAEPHLARFASGLNEGNAEAAKDMGAVIVAATNLGFALEMYLKSLRMWLQLPAPDTHDLWVLYKSIPTPVKSNIESRYDSKLSQRSPTNLFQLSVAFQLTAGRPSPPPELTGRPQLAKDLPNVLRRAGSLFVRWRYPQDSVPIGKQYSSVQTFEYSHLVLFRESLIEYLGANAHAQANVPGAAA